MKKITLGILGMSCSACSNGLEKHLNKQQGIVNASVNLVMANATIEYDDTLLDLKTIENFIKSAGFKSSGIFDLNKPAGNKEKSYPLIIFALLTVVLMYVSMGHMVGLYLPKFISPKTSPIGYALALMLLTIPFLYYGKDIFIGGVKSIIYLSPDMNALVTLGVGASFIFSVVYSVLIFLGNHTLVHNLYFESVGAVIFFVKLGRKIDGTSKAKTRQAIRDLVQITPKNAVVLRDGQEVSVTIDLVEKGDTLVCRPGEKIAVDGVITNGKAHLDESFITGESKPSLKTVGNTVVAGSVNFDGYLEYSAQKIGRDSTVSEIVNMVVEASNTKLPIAKTADKICGVFVPLVMVVAVLTFIGQLIFMQGLSQAITAFVTVLVVACPCALGLATPLAIVVGEGLCAKKGILVKNGKTMEVADKTSVVIFDKTGTLTYGDLRVFKAFNYSDLTDGELLQITASLEKNSTHPIARAFKTDAPLEVFDFENLSGYGLVGKINGKKYFVGSGKLCDINDVKNHCASDEDFLLQNGASIVYLMDESKILALYGVKDTVKKDAKEVISKLKELGVKPIMLSGDNQAVASAVAKTLGIDEFYGDVTPKEKANFVKGLKKDKKVVIMCGDGINDSPALTYADIGISVKNGTEIAIDSADVVLLGDGLSKLTEFLTVSTKTLKCIRQNLFWAFFYNAIMLPIATGVFAFFGLVINPMLASLAMVLSSITVILNTLRLKSIK